MDKAVVSLSAADRRRARRAIERAQSLILHSRWFLATFLLLVLIAVFPARILLVFGGLPVLIGLSVASTRAFEHAAEDVGLGLRWPLLGGFVGGLTVGVLALGLGVYIELLHPFGLLAVLGWALIVVGAITLVPTCIFAMALSWMNRIDAEKSLNRRFGLIVAESKEVDGSETAPPSAGVMPPRPKR